MKTLRRTYNTHVCILYQDSRENSVTGATKTFFRILQKGHGRELAGYAIL